MNVAIEYLKIEEFFYTYIDEDKDLFNSNMRSPIFLSNNPNSFEDIPANSKLGSFWGEFKKYIGEETFDKLSQILHKMAALYMGSNSITEIFGVTIAINLTMLLSEAHLALESLYSNTCKDKPRPIRTHLFHPTVVYILGHQFLDCQLDDDKKYISILSQMIAESELGQDALKFADIEETLDVVDWQKAVKMAWCLALSHDIVYALQPALDIEKRFFEIPFLKETCTSLSQFLLNNFNKDTITKLRDHKKNIIKKYFSDPIKVNEIDHGQLLVIFILNNFLKDEKIEKFTDIEKISFFLYLAIIFRHDSWSKPDNLGNHSDKKDPFSTFFCLNDLLAEMRYVVNPIEKIDNGKNSEVMIWKLIFWLAYTKIELKRNNSGIWDIFFYLSCVDNQILNNSSFDCFLSSGYGTNTNCEKMEQYKNMFSLLKLGNNVIVHPPQNCPLSKKFMNKEFLLKLVDLVCDYLGQNKLPGTVISTPRSPGELKEKLGLQFQDTGVNNDELLKMCRDYLDCSVRTSHPGFNNLLFSGFNFPAFVGEIITALTNTTMATFEVAPAASVIENELIDNINTLIGFKKGKRKADGIMVTGGSNANMIAMLCARNRILPSIKKEGIFNNNLVAFVSDQSHYSFDKASNVLGFGTKNLILVKSDAQGRMRPDILEKHIIKAISKGKVPFFIGATAGTTVFGAFDPIKEIGLIAKKYNLWYHVDGSWGGAVIFSKRYRHLLNGVEHADSFNLDTHKLLSIPLMASFFLCKHAGVLKKTTSCKRTEHFFHKDKYSPMNSGEKSLQCGRRVDALKVWMALKYYGNKGLEELIEESFSKARYVVDLIKTNPKFELIKEPQFLNICFRVLPDDKAADINKFNLRIREALIKKGKFFINYSSLKDGTFFFRMIVSNPAASQKNYLDFLHEFEEISKTLHGN